MRLTYPKSALVLITALFLLLLGSSGCKENTVDASDDGVAARSHAHPADEQMNQAVGAAYTDGYHAGLADSGQPATPGNSGEDDPEEVDPPPATPEERCVDHSHLTLLGNLDFQETYRGASCSLAASLCNTHLNNSNALTHCGSCYDC